MNEEQLLQKSKENVENYELDQKQRESVILTNAAVPIFLEGRQLKAKCPSDKDYTELDEWVKSQFIKITRLACKDLDQASRREMLEIAIKSVMGISWMDGEGARIINSVDGIAKIAHILIRDNNPEISYEWLQEACSKDFNIEEVGRVFNYFNQQLDSIKSNGSVRRTSSGEVPAKN